jgi:acetyltransferase-like isoleucine patch superfamily enzyme
MNPVRWFRTWLRDEIRRVARAELERPRVIHEDPLPLFDRERSGIEEQLRASVNVLGVDVMVGDGVIIWGGRFPAGVGVELHDRVRLYEHCRLVVDHISNRSGIVLESQVALNFGCYVEGSGGVRVRRRSILGPNVVIVSSSHRIAGDTPVQESGKTFGAVEIGEGVWIGANAVILAGITIGDRAVVGAGAVVTKDVPADTVVGGNPARLLYPSGDALASIKPAGA